MACSLRWTMPVRAIASSSMRQSGGGVDHETTVRLRVLGELAATRGGAVIDLGGRRQRAVLAALVILRDQVVPSERLAGCVWGDHPPATPPVPFRRTSVTCDDVSSPRPWPASETGSSPARPPGTSCGSRPTRWMLGASSEPWTPRRVVAPADALRTLDDALRLWRGPPYAEYAGEPWVEAEALRLTELHAVARERRLETRLELGDAGVVIGELEALVAEDPLREERWRLLALALYRAQRQAGALAALRRARETLAEELGVDPGPALRALEAEILAQSPSLDAPAPRRLDGPARQGGLPRSRSHRPTWLIEPGRSRSCADRWTSSPTGEPASCSLRAPPASASRGCSSRRCVWPRLARSVCCPRGAASSSVRSASVQSANCSKPAMSDPAARDTLLAGAASVAKPVFEEMAGDDAVSNGSFAVLHGLYWLTVNLANQRPVVICVDDIQWCDSASLRYLAYLVKRLEGLQVLVVLAMRTGEQHPTTRCSPTSPSTRRSPCSSPHRCRRSGRDPGRERLGEGADPFVAACHRMTFGQPVAAAAAAARPGRSKVSGPMSPTSTPCGRSALVPCRPW